VKPVGEPKKKRHWDRICTYNMYEFPTSKWMPEASSYFVSSSKLHLMLSYLALLIFS
jgi:hypothetical protein